MKRHSGGTHTLFNFFGVDQTKTFFFSGVVVLGVTRVVLAPPRRAMWRRLVLGGSACVMAAYAFRLFRRRAHARTLVRDAYAKLALGSASCCVASPKAVEAIGYSEGERALGAKLGADLSVGCGTPVKIAQLRLLVLKSRCGTVDCTPSIRSSHTHTHTHLTRFVTATFRATFPDTCPAVFPAHTHACNFSRHFSRTHTRARHLFPRGLSKHDTRILLLLGIVSP